jgi:hypothetical protein
MSELVRTLQTLGSVNESVPWTPSRGCFVALALPQTDAASPLSRQRVHKVQVHIRNMSDKPRNLFLKMSNMPDVSVFSPPCMKPYIAGALAEEATEEVTKSCVYLCERNTCNPF